MAIRELPPRIQTDEPVTTQDIISVLQETNEPEPIMVFDYSIEIRNDVWQRSLWGKRVYDLQNDIYFRKDIINHLSGDKRREVSYEQKIARKAMRYLLTQKP